MGSQSVTIYRSTGHLTHAIQDLKDVKLAQEYLMSDPMAQYLDPPLNEVVVRLQWHLDSDGYNYYIEAICNRELTDDELKQLASEVSGQNSDGLGEGFEQQDFATVYGDADRWGDAEYVGMCSFDWETNDSTFVRVN